jgi:CRP-like cAMP-binding protein
MARGSTAQYASNLTAAGGWFSRAPKPFRDAVLDRCLWCPVQANETLYWAADKSDDLFCCAMGTVALYSRFGTGENPLIHLARPGYWFGAASFISGESRRVSAVARGDAVIARVPARAMTQLLDARPEWWSQLAACALEYADLSVIATIDALIPDHDMRCAATLLRLAGLRPARVALDGQADVPVTQDELALLLRVSRSTLVQVLRRLNDRGLVEMRYGSLRLLDLQALDALAHSG